MKICPNCGASLVKYHKVQVGKIISTLIPGGGPVELPVNNYQSMYAAAKRLGLKITVRRTSQGFLVWR